MYFYVVLWLGALVYRWRQTPDFNKSNFFFRVGAEVFIVWLIIYELVRLVNIVVVKGILKSIIGNRFNGK